MVTVVKGDYGYDIELTLTDANSAAIDLTSGTALFKMALPGSDNIFISGTCVVNNPTGGTCHYNVKNGDMHTTGTFKYEVQIEYPTKLITATPSSDDRIEIVEEMPGGD